MNVPVNSKVCLRYESRFMLKYLLVIWRGCGWGGSVWFNLSCFKNERLVCFDMGSYVAEV